MSKMIPYPFFYDDMPVDISFVFEDEKPAGKHGFLQVSGRDFVFEDGTKGKFWGTNFNGAGCFPEHDYAKNGTAARKNGYQSGAAASVGCPVAYSEYFRL